MNRLFAVAVGLAEALHGQASSFIFHAIRPHRGAGVQAARPEGLGVGNLLKILQYAGVARRVLGELLHGHAVFLQFPSAGVCGPEFDGVWGR
jgi:hypothetical protein